MECSYCRLQISSEAPYVKLVINGDNAQVYCGSPKPGSIDGQSCWQRAIEAWHHLIIFEKAMPHFSMDQRGSDPITVRQSMVLGDRSTSSAQARIGAGTLSRSFTGPVRRQGRPQLT